MSIAEIPFLAFQVSRRSNKLVRAKITLTNWQNMLHAT